MNGWEGVGWDGDQSGKSARVVCYMLGSERDEQKGGFGLGDEAGVHVVLIGHCSLFHTPMSLLLLVLLCPK